MKTKRSWVRRTFPFAAAGLLSLGPACAGSNSEALLPANVSCGETLEAANAEELTRVLSGAASGSCVIAAAGTYRGAFEVPAGVQLVSSEGTAVFEGVSEEEPAITLNGGRGSGLHNVEIAGAPGIGVLIRSGPAELSGVTVRKAGMSGILANCTGEGCLDDDRVIHIRDTTVDEGNIGLWALGARVQVSGGAVKGQSSARITGGYGVVASEGARLDMDGTEVSRNQEVGVLVDGTKGTSSSLMNVQVLENEGRGIWAQALEGTEAAPKLKIDGADTLIRGNHIVGVGARNSKGIIILTGKVTGTVAKSVPTDIGKMEPVGDGIGLFENTGAVRLDEVALEGNARSQVLIDKGEKGIIILTGKVAKETGLYNVVVQNTLEEVQVADTSRDRLGEQLAVSAPNIPLN